MAIGTPPGKEMEQARGSDIAVGRAAGLGAGRVVSRPALFARLGASARVTVVSAPAGSGKTVLLRSWIGQASLSYRAAWVPVGRDERDTQRFWLTVLDALRGTVVGSGLVRGLTAAPDLDGWAIVERLLKDLAPLQDRLWLVVDDVHELGSDQALAQLELRAVALMNLGTAEAWSGLPDAVRHLQEGAVLAREIGRPYLEVGCLAQLGFASKIHPFATTQRRCHEAIALADRHGWGAEPVIAPALVTLAGALIWTGDFDEGERWLLRAVQALQTDTGPDISLLLHQTTAILHACHGRHREALDEFSKAEHLRSQLEGSHALASQVTGWLLATQARLGLTGEARACPAALADERANSGEIGNARTVICLAEGDPAGALAAVQDVLDGTAPVIGYVTVLEAHLLAGLAYSELGDLRAASEAAERALALAEPDRLVLPFAMTGSRELLEALPQHQTAHAALLADILDMLHGASPVSTDRSSLPPAEELSPGELRVLRYLPTNLSRPEIASELSVSPNTVSTYLRSIYAKLQVRDRSSAVQRARELQLLAAGRTH